MPAASSGRKVNPVTQDDCFVKGKAGLGAIPANEIVNGIADSSL
jgi:hypothetical protein